MQLTAATEILIEIDGYIPNRNSKEILKEDQMHAVPYSK